jgi:hypothetical protein
MHKAQTFVIFFFIYIERVDLSIKPKLYVWLGASNPHLIML